MSEKLSDGTIDMDKFKKNLEVLYSLIGDKKVISASSLKFGGAAEALTKMSLGNRIGAKFSNLTVEELFGLNYGTLLLEVEGNVDVPTEFAGTSFKVVGETISEERIVSGDYDIDFTIEELEKSIEEKLNGVFKISTEKKEEKVESKLYTERNTSKPRERIEHPKVVIPVFPGTNCEDDCARAFRKEGAEVVQVLIRNLNKEALIESVDRLEKEIRTAQIIMLPGGFSAGDEPDGSAKFIATVFRNEKIKDAVMDLLNNRDGLMLGICNGFQA